MSIKSLTFAALPKGDAADPVTHRRNKLIERLRQQIELAKDPAFKLTRQRWVPDSEGVKQLVQQPKKVRPWWRNDSAGNVILAIHYGAQKIELEKGKAGIVVGKKDKLVPVLESIISGIEAGELDGILTNLAKTAVQAKGSKRAA